MKKKLSPRQQAKLNARHNNRHNRRDDELPHVGFYREFDPRYDDQFIGF